jgi:hypothetical protein
MAAGDGEWDDDALARFERAFCAGLDNLAHKLMAKISPDFMPGMTPS